MRQAIETKYHGPSNVRGSRVSATAAAGRIILDWDHRLNPEENHAKAASTFAKKFGWKGGWSGGVVKSGVYVFVTPDREDFCV